MQSADESEHELRAAADAFAAGDYARVVELANRLVDDTASSARARAMRANASLKLERWHDAIADLDELVASQPHNAQLPRLQALCWLRIGNARKDAAEANAAIEAYRCAIAAAPELQDARHNLGSLLLALDRARDALPLLRIVAAAEPANDAAALDFARALLACGERDAAIRVAREVAARTPGEHVLQGCSELLLDAGAIDDAHSVLARIAASSPAQWPWLLLQARRLRENAAADASRDVLALLSRGALPDAARLCVDLHAALGLPAVYRDVAQIDDARAELARGLQRLTEAYSATRIAQIAPAVDSLRWDNFLLAYQGRNDRDLQQRFGNWYSAALHALIPLPATAASRRPRPRIAMISGRWHHCTVGVYYAAWVEHLAARGWEVILVHVGAYRDAWTERLAGWAQGELTLTGALADSARRVQQLDADIALYPELGMDSTVLALAALRLAPLQVSAWGHPSTTGLPTIDAFVSCADMEPANAVEHYSEHLLLLPGLGTRYPPPAIPAAATRESLGLPPGRRLYLVPQSAFKLHPDNEAMLARIVEKDTDALLVLFADRELATTELLRQRLRAALAPVTARPQQHFALLARRTREQYLAVNLACDVMVDSVHWSGGNTTLDALHCELPVVTCPGELMRGRQSAAMLRTLGQTQLIATSPLQLAERAVEMAHDPPRRAQVGRALLENLPALTQSPEPLDALDANLRALLAAPSS